MATISRDKEYKTKRFISIRLRFMLTYISLIAVVVIVLNTYPLSISRNLVFASKQTSLQGQATQIGVSLEGLELFSEDAVAQVMNMLDSSDLPEIRVYDADCELLYRSEKSDNSPEAEDVYALLTEAMKASDVFRSEFSDGAFSSAAVVPVLSKNAVAGFVYLYEYDASQGAIILGLQKDLANISIALCILALILSVVYANAVTLRITSVLDAIKTVREGEYTYRINVKGHDELAQLGDEFNSLTDRLQNTEEIRRRFVADASHELKTPLAAIRLLSDSILQNDGMDEDTVREFVGDIKDESERLGRTTGKLLDLTRLDNNVAAVRSCVNCTEVANRVVRVLRPLAEEKNIGISTDFEEYCPVMATEDDIYQIILNLAENAVKYNKENGTVSIILKKTDSSVILAVEDTGIGIPEQDMPHIFDRFYRVDKARAREAGGSGLGLSIVKSTTERHGGELTAERKEDGGMRFSVIFSLCVSGYESI